MSGSHRQEFCVRWNSHLGSIGAAFPQLLAGQRFVDVTLACEGHQVHCHRLVLAACSSYFESILAENPCKHPVIILPNEVKLWEIQALVDFMYKGEVNVTQAGLPHLLRCAEQLRIRGLYGSDAALNLNDLKSFTSKTTPTMDSGGGGESTETEDTTTNSTMTTTTTPVATTIHSHGGLETHTLLPEHLIKKELKLLKHQHQTNGGTGVLQDRQNPRHQQSSRNPPNTVQQFKQERLQNSSNTNSNAATEDDSDDAYEEDTAESSVPTPALVGGVSSAAKPPMGGEQLPVDATVEDDHNYVAHDEEDSFGGAEPETTPNSSLLQTSLDTSGSCKRVRRSEASLAQAAKCVSKGQTFQTVSNMFNIPVSTIRFYMARKGILPKRKRGRGASSANSGGASSLSSAVMSQALAQIKRDGGSPTLESGGYRQHLLNNVGSGIGYKME